MYKFLYIYIRIYIYIYISNRLWPSPPPCLKRKYEIWKSITRSTRQTYENPQELVPRSISKSRDSLKNQIWRLHTSAKIVYLGLPRGRNQNDTRFSKNDKTDFVSILAGLLLWTETSPTWQLDVVRPCFWSANVWCQLDAKVWKLELRAETLLL